MLLTALFAAVVWWVGTGLVALTVRRSDAGPAVFLQMLALFALSTVVIVSGAGEFTVAGALTGFVAAVAIWGGLELAHLVGWLTGPQKQPCPDDLLGWARFSKAVQVGLYHDLLILVVAALLWLLVWQQPNQVAATTFTVLWLMRWSAKLNLYLGVANFDSTLVPERMKYMASYMRQRASNPLFPVSLLIGCIAVWFFTSGSLSQPNAHLQTSGMLLGTLAALGVLEHALLMLPLRDSRLWRWALVDK